MGTVAWVMITAVMTMALAVATQKLWTKTDTLEEEPRPKAFRSLIFYVFLAVLLASAIVSIYFVGNIALNSNGVTLTSLGQRGDYFGGILNPLLTFITFAAFLYTLLLQRTELHESRVQFKRAADANYQTSFFQLLGMQTDLVNSITVYDPVKKSERHGRAAFSTIYSNLRREYREKRKKNPRATDERVLQAAYGTVYRDSHAALGHYMRFLYNSIVMLEKSPDSSKYIKLLRAQLSNQELLVIYYNCAVHGPGKNFKEVAERHQLFDNMPPHLLEDSHGKLLSDSAFGPGGYDALKKRNRSEAAGRLLNPPRPIPTATPASPGTSP